MKRLIIFNFFLFSILEFSNLDNKTATCLFEVLLHKLKDLESKNSDIDLIQAVLNNEGGEVVTNI